MQGGEDSARWKMVCKIGLAFLVALLALGLWTGLLDPGHSNEDLCAQGDALRTARLLDAARETYEAGDCDGLTGVELTEANAEELFAKAGVYASTEPADAVNSKKAIDNFAAGLALDPFDEEANTALALELNKELVTDEVQCDTGANLIEDGLLTVAGVALANGLPAGIAQCETALQAHATRRTTASTHLIEARQLDGTGETRDEYAEALKANANLTAAKTELEESLHDESCLDELASWIAGFPATLETALEWLIPLTVTLFLAALATWMIVRELAVRSRRARKALERWGRHPGFSFLRSAAVPDIEIAPFTGKGDGDLSGDDFSILLRGELFKSTAKGPAFPFDRVPVEPAPAGEQGVTLTDLITEIPATKVLGSLIQVTSKLFRRRVVLLCGHLTPAADKGAGVLLSLKGSRGRDASTTLWERVYDPSPGGEGAVRWLRLVPAAALWSQWHLRWAQDPTRDKEPETWEAEALSKSAEAWELKGEARRAEALYAAALEKDPGLLPAAHNLALIEIRDGHYSRAYERVTRLREVLKTDVPCGRTAEKMQCLWPTLDAASLYTTILALAYRGTDERGRLPKAIAEARVLVSTTAAALAQRDAETATEIEEKKTKKKKKKRDGKKEESTEEMREPQLQQQFAATEAPSVVILASLKVRSASKPGQRRAVRYALSEGAGVKKVSRAQLRDDDDLEALKPWSLIHGYVEEGPDLPRRTYYNLACYYATLLELADERYKAQLYDRALKYLNTGLIGSELVPWAKKDPSLVALREFKKRAFGETEFEKVLKARTVKSHEDEQKAAKEKATDE
jgi:hypothetical protein